MKINKALKALIAGGMCLSMTLGAAACTPKPDDNGGGDEQRTHDTENRAVTLAIGNLDENFNPFFFTAQYDGEATGLTQISMLSVDDSGNPICGQDEPTVALAFKQTTYDASGNITTSGDANSTTKYEFVIKKGIKFSDGVELTIKDVLFNLYVYLDPMYSGSSTIYATKIKGLNKYRSQNPDLTDDDSDDSDAEYAGEANKRINALSNADTPEQDTDWRKVDESIKKDVVSVAEEFKKELLSDWNTYKGTTSSYSENYQFKEDWEVFLFNEGQIGYEYYTDTATNTQRRLTTEGYDENGNPMGKYVTTIDVKPDGTKGSQYWLREEFESALDGLKDDARTQKMRSLAVNAVFREYLYAEKAGGEEIDFTESEEVGVITYAEPEGTGKLNRVLNEFATGTNIRQKFLNEARSEYYSKVDMKVTSIDGIKAKTTTAAQFTGGTGSALDPNETYDVLEITLNGVDPVAIYNFGFTVAPMHYYSGKVGDIDYVELCKNTDPNNEAVANRFGVAYANNEFFTSVLSSPAKNKKPVGAGAYKVIGDRLLESKDCKYERNTYFETVGTGLSNAKIKYLTYRSITEDQIINALTTYNIDFGMPNCTPKNIELLSGNSNLHNGSYRAGGFGYVGINPKFVPEIGVRRAIMKAMNVNEIVKTYYTEEYATLIRRPITYTSWVYDIASQTPEGRARFNEYDSISYTTDHDEIINLVKQSGYTEVGGDGVRYNPDTGARLKYTFTIAGETTDHPAFAMFKRAETFLTECGFEITVKTSIEALKQLATGNLAVWAAAWSSGVDPDMYQVYHYASKASSVRNWGYDVILSDETGKYDEEKSIIAGDLAEAIEAGRSHTTPESRTPYYLDALDAVMELAIELPTYQRNDLYVYNNTVIRGSSLKQNPNANVGVLSRIWELDYV